MITTAIALSAIKSDDSHCDFPGSEIADAIADLNSSTGAEQYHCFFSIDEADSRAIEKLKISHVPVPPNNVISNRAEGSSPVQMKMDQGSDATRELQLYWLIYNSLLS